MANFSSSIWPEASARFCTTQWTIVLQAGGEGPQRDEAMERFCRTYWYPVYAFIRRRGNAAEDARDLTQGFFAKLLEKDWLSGVERADARFSTLLLTVLKNHLVTRHKHDTAQKRGGRHELVSFDLVQAEAWFGAEPATDESPDRIFERRWALAVLDGALSRLRAECEATGKGRHFSELSPFLSREAAAGEYAGCGKALGLSERTVAVAVFRLRQQYRAMVREEVAAGLLDPSRVDEEMRYLAEVL